MKLLDPDNYFFCFETNKIDDDNYQSYYFFNPVKIITVKNPDNIYDFIDSLIDLSQQHYLAGFFSYEFGYLLEEKFRHIDKSNFPYALFCAFDKPVIYDHNKQQFSHHPPLRFLGQDADYNISSLKLNISEQNYIKNINTIRDYIKKGDIYQANYTVKYKFDFQGSPFGLYQDLKKMQNVAYNVFAKINDTHILSLSPELFFYKNKQEIMVKPMKGTVKRGRTLVEDQQLQLFLANDEKNRSENLMILDLLRNDLGRISEYGSVRVPSMFDVEKYNTLFQMTSTVKSKLKKHISLFDFIKSLFPCGSITGAPKIRSMEIIHELEKEERKIYTGALGFFQPDDKALFNVAIRTILLQGDKGEMGVGGGICYDSKAEDEFIECQLKGRFLTQKPQNPFKLIETMLFATDYQYLDRHLKRLYDSALYFYFSYDADKLLKQLNRIKPSLTEGDYKIRILLFENGKFTIEPGQIDSDRQDYRLCLSEHRVNSSDVFQFHKTTNRDLYNQELARVRKRRFFDLLFFNEKQELCEGSISNVYIQTDGIIYTSPIQCGLLNGIIRQLMLEKQAVQEKIITLTELKQADEVYISNSIIGFQQAKLIIES